MIPTALYIHIPWCIRKCPYCDFNSHKSPETLPERQYVAALLKDLQTDVHTFSSRKLSSIFIGGGTPSLFSAAAYEELLTGITQLLPFYEDIEITLEANPGTVEQQRFNAYRALGINRLSLGIQSFNRRHLQSLGRIHDEQQAQKAIIVAREAGFDNINIDIMYSLPEQTVDEGLADLQQALEFAPEHVSWYQLTLEPNTLFYKQQPQLPAEDESAELEEKGYALLDAHGYKRYEISAFCRDDKTARHNLNYWLYGDYFGIGAGAHSKLTHSPFTVTRLQKHRQPFAYLNPDKEFIAHRQVLDKANLLFEFMLNSLRLEQKIPYQLFNERTGLPSAMLQPALIYAKQKGLVIFDDAGWQVTAQGRRFTNDLQELFLPEQTKGLHNSPSLNNNDEI